jgi:glycosyltransferase involved in cell wall biosynthesis
LVAEIEAALADIPHEIVYVDDGSTDGTMEALRVAAAGAPVRVLRHRSSCGQSAAVVTGVRAARGAWIVTLDGDGQNDPADAPRLVEALKSGPPELALVGGERVRRQDSAAKKVASRIGNGVRKRLLRDTANDTGCGLKAFRREAFLRLPYFDHIHRYLPALMLREGYATAFLPVGHRPRTTGSSKYTNLGRLWASISDLWGVMWLQSRARRPGAVIEL